MHMSMTLQIMCNAHNDGHILCTRHPYIQTERTVYRIDERFNTFHLFEMKIKKGFCEL